LSVTLLDDPVSHISFEHRPARGRTGDGPSRGALQIEHVSKRFSGRHQTVQALENVSLRAEAGEFICLVGPSGCGKSTLLDIIAGLTRPDSGRILADGQPVTGPGRHRLVMFQDSALFPWLTVLGNVMFGLKLVPELSKAERLEIAHQHLRMVGLAKFAHNNVHELSGGMRQRAAFARALAPDPRVLLMDEPLSALDTLTREVLYRDIQRIWEAKRKTIVLVTHNVREAVCLADRVVVLSPRPGRIHEIFDIPLPRPRDVDDPALSPYVSVISAALRSHVPEELML
jgi:NitT/TauT family transport system ATP-binding protein